MPKPHTSQTGYKVRVPLKDGRAKFIRYGAPEMAEIEEILGVGNVISLFQGNEEELTNKLGFKVLIALVWAGCRGAGDKQITFDQVGEQIDLMRLKEYWENVGDAFRLSFTGTTEKKEDSAEDEESEDPTVAKIA